MVLPGNSIKVWLLLPFIHLNKNSSNSQIFFPLNLAKLKLKWGTGTIISIFVAVDFYLNYEFALTKYSTR